MEQDDQLLAQEIRAHYFPGDGEINFWTFAMIGISCTFLVFVGFSVFIMCRSDVPQALPVRNQHHKS